MSTTRAGTTGGGARRAEGRRDRLGALGLAGAIGALVVLTTAVQARRQVDGTRAQLERVRKQAGLVADAAVTAAALQAHIAEVERDIERAERLDWPVDVGTVLGRAVERFPLALVLEKIRIAVRPPSADTNAGDGPGISVGLAGAVTQTAALEALPERLEAAGLPRPARLDYRRGAFEIEFVVAFPATGAAAQRRAEARP